jgi:DNA polymerase-1
MQNIVTGKDGFEEGDWWREAFRAPKGYVFVGCDYSGQETHVVAHKAQDSAMLKALRNKEDLHKLAASALFNIPVEQVTKQQRRDGKTTNFAIAYGAGASKLAAQFKIPLSAGKKLINNYYATFSGLKAFQEKSYQHTVTHGWIDVDSLGRKSYVPNYNEYLYLSKLVKYDLDTPDHRKRLRTIEGMMFRDSSNYPVQGESATMTKFACVLIRSMLKGTSGKLILTIHDEVIVQCLKKEAPKIRKIVERCMSVSANIFCHSVRIPAEATTSNCWSK